MEYGIFITERMQPMASKSKSIIGGMTVLGGLVLGLALGALASWLVDSLANKSKKKQSV